MPIALASSSPPVVIDAVLDRFGLRDRFAAIRSGEDEERGKPHPGIYLNTCAALGVARLDAVALEDSLPGLIAATAARMRCVAVPAAEDFSDVRFLLADVVLRSLLDLNDTVWARVEAC